VAHNGRQPPGPEVVQLSVHRATEDAPHGDLNEVRLAQFGIDEDGDLTETTSRKRLVNYRMEVFLPATLLHGFDPETNSRLGFFYRLRDRECGDQLLAAGPELPYWEDPSLWHILELAR
jgi:hypothetical protein